MNGACNNNNNLNQNDLEQFEGTISNVLNGINNTNDRKKFKGRPKFELFCSYCCSMDTPREYVTKNQEKKV